MFLCSVCLTLCRVIKAMVDKYPDCLHYQDDKHRTPFITSCDYGHVQLAEVLITEYNIGIEGQLVSNVFEY